MLAVAGSDGLRLIGVVARQPGEAHAVGVERVVGRFGWAERMDRQMIAAKIAIAPAITMTVAPAKSTMNV
ncbi:hypothetical protein AX769_07605 [Frondihabitans sp. PAMC 28766]|nr:hypothetical protein AX769_07605 [Frondihabitans sp. PAMC 28766]